MASPRAQTALVLFIILILILAIWLVYTYFLRPESVPTNGSSQLPLYLKNLYIRPS